MLSQVNAVVHIPLGTDHNTLVEELIPPRQARVSNYSMKYKKTYQKPSHKVKYKPTLTELHINVQNGYDMHSETENETHQILIFILLEQSITFWYYVLGNSVHGLSHS